MKYRIAYAETASELEVKVNSLMDMGWQPIGGMTATRVVNDLSSTGSADFGYNYLVLTGESFYQAMIYRHAPKPPGSPE